MKKTIALLLTALCYAVSFLHAQPVGVFDGHGDIGNPRYSGAAAYDPEDQSYHLKASGRNIWSNRDEFHYLYKQLSGDFTLTAEFEFTGDQHAPGHRKMGWMIRESLDDDAAAINAVVHLDGLTVLQWRALRGAYMRDPEDELFFPKINCGILKLERTGRTITMYAAHRGEPFQLVGSHDMSLRDTVYAGLFLCAHDSSSVADARIWNVRIDKPVSSGYDPNKQGWLGCRLEILDLASGNRKMIYESTGRFEAPNWMPDGQHLLFNANGSLFTIPVNGGTPQPLNTGSANRNNNDHGISFDGKWLAISSHRAGMTGGGSTVYVLPLAGGEPRMITDSTPSYFHGWSPDGKYLVFVGMRGSKVFNLYKVPAAGGKEMALTTNTTGHVDGPEYSPDGKYIYYNANASGTMQIWRMKPDGTGKEQLTFDEYHNWFPHISPDGQWMVFISFPIDIHPDAHPSYKQVMLRLMPLHAAGGPRVIASLYGGQGTLNAPSWSPDSKKIAFVSNSGRP